MATAYRLYGNRDLAASYRGEAYRLMFVLDQVLGENPQGAMSRSYPDGTLIIAQKVFDNNIISVLSPFRVAEEEVKEIMYYLRLAFIQSIVDPDHHYQFFEIEGSGLPPDEITEMDIEGTSEEYLQAPYFLTNNRSHKRDDDDNPILFPIGTDESFDDGTVDVPGAYADWDEYETDDYFDAWHETLTRQASTYTEDDSGWGTDEGTYTYTQTRNYTRAWTDKNGIHSTSAFLTDTVEASDDVMRTGDVYPAGSACLGTLSCTRNMHAVAGSDADMGSETMDLSNLAIGNSLVQKIVHDVELWANGSFSDTWVDTGGGHYHITSMIDETITTVGTQILYMGETEVDSGEWDLTVIHTGTDTHDYGEWADGSGTINGTETVFTLYSFCNVEDYRFAVFYKKATRISDKTFAIHFDPDATGSVIRELGSDPFPYCLNQDITRYNVQDGGGTSSGTVTITNDYYLAVKTGNGLEKILLANHTITTVLDPYSQTTAGQKATLTHCNLTEKFILYAYQTKTYTGGVWVTDGYTYGVVDIESGEKQEYEYTPAEYYGPYNPSIFMYLPQDPDKQP